MVTTLEILSLSGKYDRFSEALKRLRSGSLMLVQASLSMNPGMSPIPDAPYEGLSSIAALSSDIVIFSGGLCVNSRASFTTLRICI